MIQQLKDFFNWRIFIVLFCFLFITELLNEIIGWYFNISSFDLTPDVNTLVLYGQFLIMTILGVWFVHALNRILPWDQQIVWRIIFEMVGFIALYTVINYAIAQITVYVTINQFLGLTRDLIYTTAIGTFHMLVFIPFLEFFISFKSNYENKLKVQALQLELAQNQYDLLKAKINPHFVFNSLSVLNSLITIDPAKAKSFTHSFSDVMRLALDFEHVDHITLDEEFRFLEQYMFLLNTRFGEALQVRLSVDRSDFHYRIPPMTLQLLIENVVKHNVISRKSPMQIEVYSDRAGLVIANPIQLKKAETSWGIGLEHIRTRYERLGKEMLVEQDQAMFRVILPFI
ncbi:histidine kinase [Pontibacter sp. G13]|uniref:sensor histidine kinase n=1 Tax=Pontibacter sp. G13 TaxID=3074898 RepID=UPI00288BD202|nr:histidine kinase [Pontibacter sp. G13]WNJ18274.1 histidine kinase [Pontibacter sp. G13]